MKWEMRKRSEVFVSGKCITSGTNKVLFFCKYLPVPPLSRGYGINYMSLVSSFGKNTSENCHVVQQMRPKRLIAWSEPFLGPVPGLIKAEAGFRTLWDRSQGWSDQSRIQSRLGPVPRLIGVETGRGAVETSPRVDHSEKLDWEPFGTVPGLIRAAAGSEAV
jgi:hypothetical protein